MARTKTLKDETGRTVDTGRLTQPQAVPGMTLARRPDAMSAAAGLTPPRLAQLLRGSILGDPEHLMILAEEMEERHEHYAAVLGVRKRQVAGLEITVEEGGNDGAAKSDAAFIRDMIARDGFETELIDILDAIGKGFSATEIDWDREGGQWRVQRLRWLDPRSILFDLNDGETPYLRTRTGPEPLAPYGWIWHVAKTKSGLPVRGGLARSAAWNFLFRSFTLKDWAVFTEAYGQPMRVGKYHDGAKDEQKQVLIDALRSIGTDFAAVIPEGMLIELVKADVTGSHELYEKRTRFLDEQISKLVLGQTATTDAIAGGYAVGKVHRAVADDIEKSDARQLAATLNRDLVRPLIDLNFGPRDAYPKIRIGRPEEVDAKALVDNVTRLVPLGFKVPVDALYERIGIRQPEAGDDVLSSPRETTGTAPGDGGKDGVNPEGGADDDDGDAKGGEADGTTRQKALQVKRKAVALAAGTQAGDADAISAAADMMDGDWRRLTGDLVESLEVGIRKAGSLAEARAAIAQVAADLDVDDLREALARLTFQARLAGEADAEL